MATPETEPSNGQPATTTDETGALRGAAVVLLRVLQGASVAAAFLFVVGSLLANQSIMAFMAIALLALVLLGFTIVLELGIRMVR